MTNLSTKITGLAVALGLGLVPLSVVAQSETPAPQSDPAPQASPAPVDVSNEKLDTFVLAMVEVESVRQEYIPRIEAASSEDEREAIATEGNAAIMERVDGVPGISFDEYVQIAEAAGSDPELGQKISDRLEAMQSQTD